MRMQKGDTIQIKDIRNIPDIVVSELSKKDYEFIKKRTGIKVVIEEIQDAFEELVYANGTIYPYSWIKSVIPKRIEIYPDDTKEQGSPFDKLSSASKDELKTLLVGALGSL